MKRSIFLIWTVVLLTVTMTACKDDKIAVTGVTLDKVTFSLQAGTDFILIANIEPENADNKNVKWATMNPVIADVSANGKVTAKTAGTATITVITMDGGFKKECVVTVTPGPVPVSGISVQPTFEIETGKEEWLTYTIIPATAANKLVTAESETPDVADVVEIDAENSRIKLKGNSTGTADISIITIDGGFKRECVVTVTPEFIPVNNITVQPTFELEIDKEDWITYTIIPETATNKLVTAESEPPGIADVVEIDAENSRIKLKGISTGTADIIVTTLDGDHSDFCTVTVSSGKIYGNRLINPGFESINTGVNDNGNVALTNNIPGWDHLVAAWFNDFYKTNEEKLPPTGAGPGSTAPGNTTRVNSNIGNWWNQANGVPFVNPVPGLLPSYTFLVGSNLCRVGGGGNATGGFYQTVPVTPGETYKFGGRTGGRGGNKTDFENFKDGRMMILSPDGMTVLAWFSVDYENGDGNPDLTLCNHGSHIMTFFVAEKKWKNPEDSNITEVRFQYAQRNFTVDAGGSLETTGLGTPIICWDEMFFELVED